MNNKRQRVLAALLLGFSALLLTSMLTTGHDWGDDFAAFIMQARSIVSGSMPDFIEANRFAMQQSTLPLGPVAYPWGYPLLLAPIVAIFGPNPMALKAVGAMAYMAFLLVLWIGFRRRNPGVWRLALVALFAFNPTMLTSANQILSDLPFLLVSTIGVLLIVRIVVERHPWISPRVDPALLGLTMAMACFIRSNGILLLGLLAVTQMVEFYLAGAAAGRPPTRGATRLLAGPVRRCWIGWRRAGRVALLPYMVFAGLTIVWELVFPQGGHSHIAFFSRGHALGMARNLLHYMTLPAEFFQPLPGDAALLLLGVSFPFAVLGFLQRYRADYPMALYAVMTLALYTLWPIPQGLRFLFPVLPFYVAFALQGVRTAPALLDGRAGRTSLRVVSMTAIMLLVVIFAVSSVVHGMRNLAGGRAEPDGPYHPDFQELFGWIAATTPPDAVIVFPKPRAMRLFADRQAIAVDDVARLEHADYLGRLHGHGRGQMSPGVFADLLQGGGLRRLWGNKTVEFFRVDHEAIDVFTQTPGGTKL